MANPHPQRLCSLCRLVEVVDRIDGRHPDVDVMDFEAGDHQSRLRRMGGMFDHSADRLKHFREVGEHARIEVGPRTGLHPFDRRMRARGSVLSACASDGATNGVRESCLCRRDNCEAAVSELVDDLVQSEEVLKGAPQRVAEFNALR